MFESDDFDQVLSQFEFPEDVVSLRDRKQSEQLQNRIQNLHVANDSLPTETLQKLQNSVKFKSHKNDVETNSNSKSNDEIISSNETKNNNVVNNIVSPKQSKRKIIHSYFDHKSKRKFPGPAGLLTGGFEENKDENICHLELLSQDVDFTQNGLRGNLFESPLWTRLLEDLKTWNIQDVDSIKTIKQQAISGNLKRRKAHIITAFVETVDRSATDPLIIMRDTTGNIKGTLHRDAWSTLSKYIASEYCAFILWKPTILITGGAFKKHYLNITLSNILAIYSSTVLTDDPDNKPLPDGYEIVYEDDYTVIKTQNNISNLDSNDLITNGFDNNDLLEGLDNIFSDDKF